MSSVVKPGLPGISTGGESVMCWLKRELVASGNKYEKHTAEKLRATENEFHVVDSGAISGLCRLILTEQR